MNPRSKKYMVNLFGIGFDILPPSCYRDSKIVFKKVFDCHWENGPRILVFAFFVLERIHFLRGWGGRVKGGK